jgi:RNase P subunit RPR2
MGETNGSGTPYRVLLPGEIEICLKYRAERTARQRGLEVAESEIDYYNVRENRLKVYLRDGYKCRYCGKQLTQLTATLDHVTAVAQGGENDLDNLVTACLMCNSEKCKRPVGDFLAERPRELPDNEK